MKAIILAAGFGTRLRPLTEIKPKALMPVVNRPIIARNIEYLNKFSIKDITITSHHHYEQMVNYIQENTFDINVDIKVEPEILGTGGGIGNCLKRNNNGSTIVINSDILTDIDLAGAYDHHESSGSIVTLVLHRFEPFNQIIVDNINHIIAIAREKKPDSLAFTGIHIIEPEILDYIPDGYSDIIDCYRTLISSGKTISAFISEGHYWHDIGTIEGYLGANKEILSEEDKMFSVGANSHMAKGSGIAEWAVIGENVSLGTGVTIKRSVLWDNINIIDNIEIVDSVITSDKEVKDNVINQVY